MTRLPMSAFRRQLRGIPREFPASYPQSPPSHPQFPGQLPAGTQRPGAHTQRDIRTHAQAQARREVLWRMLGRHPETKTRAAYDVSAGRTTRDVAAGPQGVGSVGMDGRRACKSAAWLWVYEHLYGPTDRAIVLLQVCSHTANARMTRTHARARAHAHAHARTHTHTHTHVNTHWLGRRRRVEQGDTRRPEWPASATEFDWPPSAVSLLQSGWLTAYCYVCTGCHAVSERRGADF